MQRQSYLAEACPGADERGAQSGVCSGADGMGVNSLLYKQLSGGMSRRVQAVSISTTPHERSRAGERVRPGFWSRKGEDGKWAEPGREFSPGTASDNTPTTTGEQSRAGERGQPWHSL